VPLVSTNGISLEVEVLTPPAGSISSPAPEPPVLLIMGLGMQLTAWPDAFVDGLLARGHTVIRFDNRDIGLSSKLAEWGRPRLLLASMRHALGLRVRASYTLADMAADTVGMLDALTVARVHVVGVSMGGMIGQIVAAGYPDRVASFTCIMSSSGARELPGPTRAARRALLSRPRDLHDIESIIDHYVKVFGVIGSPGFPSSVHMLREQYGRSVRRSHHPVGSARQLMAIIASGSRSRLLANIKTPTTIVHGNADPLVPVAAAHDLARKIPHAHLRVIDRMGHDLPPGALPMLLAAIEETIDRAKSEA
jgi:pimeloyl-ACP methyl ester carboxylesterase